MFKHILIRGNIKEAPTPNDVAKIEAWFARLVDAVDMDVLLPPVATWCDVVGNEGMTGLVAITTSHASAHWWPTFYKFDLFSCKDFTLDQISPLLKDLTTTDFTYMIIDRTGDMPVVLESGYVTL